MRYILSTIYKNFLNPELDFRIRLFNVLAFIGALVSLLSAASSALFSDPTADIAMYIGFSLFSLIMLVFATKSGKYQLCYKITIAVVFLIGFPIFFFESNVYYGAMPYFFIFAIIFTIFMLDGKPAIWMSALELLLYTGICIFAYLYLPDNEKSLDRGFILFETVFGFALVSISLGAAMIMHFRLRDEQQRKLDEQNSILTKINRSKTEFLANTSHEMRTPLTVISVNVQNVMDMLDDIGVILANPEAAELLADAQSEIMRLSRMVGGMLKLAANSETTDRRKSDFSALLQSAADMLWLLLQKNGNDLETDVADGMIVFCDTDLLTQVIVNLIQNSHTHTENDVIRLSAGLAGGMITVTVSDSGAGIAPELLPRVFDRGVTDGTGTGVGLSLCKTVVESHGGEIWIESSPGKGTSVHFTLPVYEGQYGEADGI